MTHPALPPVGELVERPRCRPLVWCLVWSAPLELRSARLAGRAATLIRRTYADMDATSSAPLAALRARVWAIYVPGAEWSPLCDRRVRRPWPSERPFTRGERLYG